MMVGSGIGHAIDLIEDAEVTSHANGEKRAIVHWSPKIAEPQPLRQL